MASKNRVASVFLILIIILSTGCIQRRDSLSDAESETVIVFDKSSIHFDPNRPDKYASETIKVEDNGRIILSTLNLPAHDGSVKITVYVALHPFPKDEISVHDKWDRAGNVRLSREGMPDIEIVKFITAYGGFTEYKIDVSHLAPLLRGECTFKGFVDTWMSPGWKIDFRLTIGPDRYADNPVWTEGLLFENSFDEENMGAEGVSVDVTIPDGMNKVLMNYLVSGHCTDGRDADEFVSKDNVIYVDGREVNRFKPWRDDCLQFRAINPYCRRWSDGTWSSDYGRSGWCPGDKVDPVQIDLSPHLTPGRHTVRFVVENIRPRDELNHYGYWRISSHLLGWTD